MGMGEKPKVFQSCVCFLKVPFLQLKNFILIVFNLKQFQHNQGNSSGTDLNAAKRFNQKIELADSPQPESRIVLSLFSLAVVSGPVRAPTQLT